MTNDTVIEVTDLHQTYGSFTAVDGISFEVPHGQVFALLGTNGAGKTTTMDVLEGFQAPTEGSVSVFGVAPHGNRRRIAGRIGIMLQEAGFFQGLTPSETIDAWRRFTPRARSRDEILGMVGLEERAATPVGRMSGGEKRRLDLALALIGRPELLFLDEPTTGLDPEARRQTWGVLRDLVAGGMTVVLTTHYMEEAEFLADHVVIMDHGKIVREGSISEIVSDTDGQISFRLPADVSANDLPPLERTRVEETPDRVTLLGGDTQRTLTVLCKWAESRDIALSDIEVKSASLEDVFLDVATKGSEV